MFFGEKDFLDRCRSILQCRMNDIIHHTKGDRTIYMVEKIQLQPVKFYNAITQPLHGLA